MNARTALAESVSALAANAAPATSSTAWWGVISLALLLSISGCRSAAYRDVYQEKMASEIRILEDQLYEADYHNQVLIDELERARARVAVADAQPVSPAVESPRPTRPLELPAPEPEPAQRVAPTPTLPARPIPGATDRVAPPAVAIPPGREELQLPDVDLGEPVPPGGPAAPAEPPPGQIQLPDSVRRLYREQPAVPVALRINRGLSGGHRFDDAEEKTGMHLAIEAIDEQGNPVAFANPEFQATLSVALLDPQRDAAEAELGQWSFTGDELRSMIRPGSDDPNPGDRIHVYLPWNQKQPLGSEVIAHVGLSTAELELKTHSELTTADAAVAQWNPRAGGKSR